MASTGMPTVAVVAALVGLLPGPTASGSARGASKPSSRPTLALRASPSVALTPVRVYFVGEIKGGPDDNEALYCPTVAWDWGDDTVSESQADCEPFQPGKSRIQRFHSIEHLFRVGGLYQVKLTLKQGTKPVLSASIELTLGDPSVATPRGPHTGAAPAAPRLTAARAVVLN